MKTYIVTIKLAKNSEHNPRDKKTGMCPLGTGICTDATGEHHSYFVTGESVEAVRQSVLDAGWTHVTRVEEVVL